MPNCRRGGEELLDWVEVGAVERQEEEMGGFFEAQSLGVQEHPDGAPVALDAAPQTFSCTTASVDVRVSSLGLGKLMRRREFIAYIGGASAT